MIDKEKMVAIEAMAEFGRLAIYHELTEAQYIEAAEFLADNLSCLADDLRAEAAHD